MAKKDKKTKNKAKTTTKPSASKAKSAKKPVKNAAPKKAAKVAKTKALAPAKVTPKTVEVQKKAQALGSSPTAKKEAIKKEVKKKTKRSLDDNDDLFDQDFEDYDSTGIEDFKNKTPEELEEIRALLGEMNPEGDEVEIALRDVEGRLYCKVRDCDELSIVDGYCRFHYLKLWKRIQLRKKILTDGKLEKYIEELTQRYPDKYIEMIRDDLKSEKAFLTAIQELEIEDVNEDVEVDDDQELIDEVRGTQTSAGTTETDDDSF